jgi:hypothetical protein
MAMTLSAADFVQLTAARRSVRKLKAGPLDDATYQTIADAALWSPSNMNTQPWQFVFVRQRHAELWALLDRLAQERLDGDARATALGRIAGMRTGLFTVLPYIDQRRLSAAVERTPARREEIPTWAVEAIGMAQLNLWLAVTAAGLGTSLQHWQKWSEPEVNDFLGVPEGLTQVSIMAVGYPDEAPAANQGTRDRAILHFERFSE